MGDRRQRLLSLVSSAKKGKKLGTSRVQRKREAYLKRGGIGTGSATDGAMPAARLKIATAIEARIGQIS